jgi:hypothetical protein
VIKLIGRPVESIVDDTQSIDGLQQTIAYFFADLPHVIVDTFRIDDGVFPQWIVGHLFGRQVFDAFD